MINHQEIIPGVHRIVLPLPFELEAINIYLVKLPDGYLLIDCGMDTPESFAALEAGIKASAAGWKDIRILVLTHMHPDHIGLTKKVLERTGATIMMNETEAAHLDSLEDEGRRMPYMHDAYRRGGVPPQMQSQMDDHFKFVRKSLHRITPDRLLKNGDSIDSAIGPLEVIETPGHSPGHICLYAPRVKVLFSGDHILNQITPNISWHPGTDALGDYLDSLERVGKLDVDRILPAHGEPFTGHRNWIRETGVHHAERCDQIVTALGTGANTAHEIVGRLWTRVLQPIHHHFAVFEVLAHLEYMQRRGRVHAQDDLYWSA